MSESSVLFIHLQTIIGFIVIQTTNVELRFTSLYRNVTTQTTLPALLTHSNPYYVYQIKKICVRAPVL